MKRVINSWGVLCFLFLLNSCKQSRESPDQYITFLKEDENLNKKITIGKVEYTFRIQTPEVMALKSATSDDGKTDQVKYKERLKELTGHRYVNIEMQLQNHKGSVLKYNLKDRSEYEQRVMYYEFYAKDDLKLICNGKELQPESYQYENHLDLMPYNTMVIAFPLCNEAKDFQILFNDRAFSNLFIKVNFNKEDINSLPKLTLN